MYTCGTEVHLLYKNTIFAKLYGETFQHGKLKIVDIPDRKGVRHYGLEISTSGVGPKDFQRTLARAGLKQRPGSFHRLGLNSIHPAALS